MTAHPYRTPWAPEPQPPIRRTLDATVAFAVLAFTGAVQLASSLVVPDQPPAFTLAGGAALIAALGWFARREH